MYRGKRKKKAVTPNSDVTGAEPSQRPYIIETMHSYTLPM